MSESLRGGRFVVLGTLGRGAQGHTFDGVDKRVGQAVAIKRFDVRGAASWKDVDLAEREARVLQSLSHPKLPRYVDHFEEDGALYLVMEKIDGESLGALRKRGVTLRERDVVRLLRDASEVLDYLHGRAPPVIHRDLKPGNVLRRPDGGFAFVDFGAVRDRLRPEGGSTVVGTFGYMAPEQFQGRALPGSDVYAVGATALAMLTGKEPEQLPHKGLAIDVRAALRGQASERLVAVLEKMLDPDPDRRAARIGPLLARLDDGRLDDGRPDHGSREPRRPASTRDDRRGQQEENRFARRQARRAARHAERMARRERGRQGRPPFPFSTVLTLLFLVGMLAVSMATQVVVPIVLTVLSVFFARRALLSAVASVRNAGHRAVSAMDRVRRRSDEEPHDEAHRDAHREPPRVRVDPAPTAGRKRVDERERTDPPDAEDAEDADDADDAGERARRR
jgi:hypothetical protein